jgi:hypothetical protein
MHDSQRYRYNAAECLLASRSMPTILPQTSSLMAASWLSLAQQDEAMDILLARWDTAEPVKTDGLVLSPRAA